MDVEVWIDGNSHVRRMSIDMGAGLDALAKEVGDDLPGGGLGMVMTFDFFDYGDDAIEIDVPADSDTVDVTDKFVELYESLPLDPDD